MSDWTLDGTTVTIRPDIAIDPTTLALSFQVTRQEAESTWRSYDPVDVERVTGVDGRYRTFSKRGVSPMTVEPATSEQPPFASSFDAHVVDYQESPITDQQVVIALGLERVANIQTGNGVSTGTGAYELAFDVGSIGLDASHVQPVTREGSATGTAFTLPLLLNDTQAVTLIDNANAPDAIVERAIPDGDDVVADATLNERHTIDLTTPTDAPLNSQTAIVEGWSLSEAAKGGSYRWRAELDLRYKSTI